VAIDVPLKDFHPPPGTLEYMATPGADKSGLE
jgi:hypothetical protein